MEGGMEGGREGGRGRAAVEGGREEEREGVQVSQCQSRPGVG